MAYTYYKDITIDKTKVMEDCTDFPVLIKVTDANLAHTSHGGHCESINGYDIGFKDADNLTTLSHELVAYNHETGAVVFWVKKPILDCDANDHIFMYYGDSGIVADQSSTNTWAANYLLVAHGKDADTSHIHDSTSNANDGTKKAANQPAVYTSGKIYHGQDFDGSDDYIVFENNVFGLGNKTCSYWVNRDVDTDDNIEVSNTLGGASDNKGIETAWWNYGSNAQSSTIGNTATSGHYFSVVGGVSSKNNWHYITVVQNGSTNFKLYIDGNLSQTNSSTDGTEAVGEYNLRWGSSGSGTYFADMKSEELRCSNAVKSANWIHTEYHNQNDPATFMSFGAETPVGGGGTAWTKALPDTVTISDAIARTSVWNRSLTNTVSLSDLISKKPGKGFTETLTISDDFDYLRGLLLSDTLALSDARSFTYEKNLSNLLMISDETSSGGVIRPNIKFDYGKTLSDVFNISDLMITLKYFARYLTDTLTISDDFQYLRGFDIFDSLSISDSKIFGYGKNLSNTLSLNDLVRSQVRFLRTVSDTLTISDSCITSLYTAWFKVLADTLTLNDLFRSKTSFNKSISETLSISETFQKDFHKILGDTLSLYEAILYFKTASFLLALYDTLSLNSAMTWLKNQNLTLSDTLLISDYILAISSKDMEFLDSTGTVLVYLRRPYWDNLDGSLNFNSLNFAFRSGNYTSYVEDINDESITMTGFESANDVLTRFNKIAKIADDGTEITISLLGTEWDATYVVSSFTYRPIGLDVFEYTITLKLVR